MKTEISGKAQREIICIYLRTKKYQMKLLSCIVLFLCITGFSSCENHMDINDIVPGTPTRADTVLLHKFPTVEKKAATPEHNNPAE